MDGHNAAGDTDSIPGTVDHRAGQMEMDVDMGTGMDTGSDRIDDAGSGHPDRGDPRQIGDQKKEKVAMRKLRRIVARYRMRQKGIRHIGYRFYEHWKDYLPEIYGKKGRRR